MSGTHSHISVAAKTISIPTPIISLGANFFLQHNLNDDITAFMSAMYTSSVDSAFGPETKTGSDWANDKLHFGISFPQGYTEWLKHTPMLFLEVYNSRAKSNRHKRLQRTQFTHPPSRNGELNRGGSNYGGGDPSPLVTEWDVTTDGFKEQFVAIDPHLFYRNPSLPMPQRKVDFVTNNGNQLRWARGWSLTPTGSGDKAVNTFIQPIRFRFGILDKDKKTVILGDPSDKILVMPKSGYFTPQDDHYFYDFQAQFER